MTPREAGTGRLCDAPCPSRGDSVTPRSGSTPTLAGCMALANARPSAALARSSSWAWADSSQAVDGAAPAKSYTIGRRSARRCRTRRWSPSLISRAPARSASFRSTVLTEHRARWANSSRVGLAFRPRESASFASASRISLAAPSAGTSQFSAHTMLSRLTISRLSWRSLGGNWDSQNRAAGVAGGRRTRGSGRAAGAARPGRATSTAGPASAGLPAPALADQRRPFAAVQPAVDHVLAHQPQVCALLDLQGGLEATAAHRAGPALDPLLCQRPVLQPRRLTGAAPPVLPRFSCPHAGRRAAWSGDSGRRRPPGPAWRSCRRSRPDRACSWRTSSRSGRRPGAGRWAPRGSVELAASWAAPRL